MLGGEKATCDLKNRVGLHIGHRSTSYSKGAYTRVRLRHGRGPSFDHLVGAEEDRRWYFDPERLCGAHIYDEFKLGRSLYWQVTWARSSKDAVHVLSRAAKMIGYVKRVCQQPARSHKCAEAVSGR